MVESNPLGFKPPEESEEEDDNSGGAADGDDILTKKELIEAALDDSPAIAIETLLEEVEVVKDDSNHKVSKEGEGGVVEEVKETALIVTPVKAASMSNKHFTTPKKGGGAGSKESTASKLGKNQTSIF